MGAVREKDQADFDLERFVDMFDEAMTSQDPRVVRALRDLMMMVTLTRPESRDTGLIDRQRGPLRRLFEDIYHLNNRLNRVEEDQSQLVRQLTKPEYNYKYDYPYEKYTMKAAAEMASQIDQDVLSKLEAQAQSAMQPKGLTKK